MSKFSIYNWFGFTVPMEQRLRMIKEAGFDSTFLWWGDEFAEVDGPKEQVLNMAQRNGLSVENVHLPYFDADLFWIDSLESDSLVALHSRRIEECAIYNIPTAVLHITAGNEPPPFTELGLDKIKRLVETAEKTGVNIALENLRRPEYLEFVFSGIQSDRLRFCFDSGHEYCCTKDADYLSKYGAKLAALHLHDNEGMDDLHRIPGEGSIDWSVIASKLASTGYTGPVSLEVTNEFSQFKGRETAEQFLRRAYEAAVLISEKMGRGCRTLI